MGSCILFALAVVFRSRLMTFFPARTSLSFMVRTSAPSSHGSSFLQSWCCSCLIKFELYTIKFVEFLRYVGLRYGIFKFTRVYDMEFLRYVGSYRPTNPQLPAKLQSQSQSLQLIVSQDIDAKLANSRAPSHSHFHSIYYPSQ